MTGQPGRSQAARGRRRVTEPDREHESGQAAKLSTSRGFLARVAGRVTLDTDALAALSRR